MLEPQNFNFNVPREQLGFDKAILSEQLKFGFLEDSPTEKIVVTRKTPPARENAASSKTSPAGDSVARKASAEKSTRARKTSLTEERTAVRKTSLAGESTTGRKKQSRAKTSGDTKSQTRTAVTKRAAADTNTIDNPIAPTSLFDRSQNSLAAFTRMTMEKGSKSFSLAALLFARPQRESARLLYAWCRACDDAIDEAPSRREALRRLEEITQLTKASLSSDPDAFTSSTLTGANAQDPTFESSIHASSSEVGAFAAFKELCRRHDIPSLYPLELLEGMRMDVEGYRYRTQRDLDLYCYRVASVVGLMMVHVMGISSSRALRHAVDTGLAMQMTNIARDIRDDYEMRRIYIPDQWFNDANLTVPKQFDPKAFAPVVRRLVRRADELYASGREGLKYLPFRAALAVAAAQLIYREIGVEVVRRGEQAWESRTVIPLSRKLALMAKAIGQVIASRFTREARSPHVSPTIVFGPEKI